MKHKITLVILVSTLLISIFTGCGQKKDERTKLELTIWGSPEERSIITYVINKFEKENPTIKVLLTHIPYNEYQSKIMTRAGGGQLPDVMFVEIPFLERFVEKKMIKNLDPLVENTQFDKKQYFPQIIKRFTVNGSLYGLPRDIAPFALVYYNKDVLAREGLSEPKEDWTLNDLKNMGLKLKETDKKGRVTRYGFNAWDWHNFIYTYGGRMVDDIINPQVCVINEPQAIKGMEFYVDLMNKWEIMPKPSALQMDTKQSFIYQKSVMMLSGVWETPSLRKTKEFDWDVQIFPKGPTGERGIATGGSGYAVSTDTKHPMLAWKLLKAISGEESQKKLARMGLAQPALINLAEGRYWAQDKDHKPLNKGILNKAIKDIVYKPRIPEWSRISTTIIGPEIENITRQKLTPAKGLTKIKKSVDKELREMNRQNH